MVDSKSVVTGGGAVVRGTDSIGGPTLGVDIELGGSVVVLSVSRDSVVVD